MPRDAWHEASSRSPARSSARSEPWRSGSSGAPRLEAARALAFIGFFSTSSTCCRSSRSTAAGSSRAIHPALWAGRLPRPARPRHLPAEPAPDHHSRLLGLELRRRWQMRGHPETQSYYSVSRPARHHRAALLRPRRAPRARNARDPRAAQLLVEDGGSSPPTSGPMTSCSTSRMIAEEFRRASRRSTRSRGRA